jgi:hypothetical protein
VFNGESFPPLDQAVDGITTVDIVTWRRQVRGGSTWVSCGLVKIRLAELRKGINFDPNLGLEYGESGGKYLDEHKRMNISNIVSEMFNES